MTKNQKKQNVVTGDGQVREGGLQSDVSRLCRGLPGHGGKPGEFGVISPDLEGSLSSGTMPSMALLFWLDEDWRCDRLDIPVRGGGMMIELRLVGGSSSPSISSMSGMCVSESSMRNSGWVMKLWMELRDSGVSSPS